MDIAVTSGMRGDMLHKSADDGTSAAIEYEHFKRSYLNTEQKCHENGITFIPLIMEAHGGGWGSAATAVWNQVAKYKSTISGDTVSTSAMLISQSMGLILHRENARAILRRSQINDNSEFIELPGAYAACSSSVDVLSRGPSSGHLGANGCPGFVVEFKNYSINVDDPMSLT